jgi:lipopolysaccharide transport system permease protein
MTNDLLTHETAPLPDSALPSALPPSEPTAEVVNGEFAPHTEPPVMRIAPSSGWASLKLGELWAYRELLLFLTWRDIKVRYKQTALGAAWAILQPLLNAIIFSFLFQRVGRVQVPHESGFIFTFSGMVAWQFFAFGITQSANSLVTSSNLIKKVYFPRLAVPIATVLSGAVDFLIAFGILLVMMPFFKTWPSANIVFVPLFLLLGFTSALGVGLWLAALNVHYRDVRYIVGFLTQFWMLATPLAYPIEAFAKDYVPEQWRFLLGLNPMAGVVDGFRWAVIGTPLHGDVIALSAIVALLLLGSGAVYFRRMERTFADVV